MFKKGDLCKHFKGEDLIHKNIYEILETGVKYTGNAQDVKGNLVVYKNMFQENQIFAREEVELTEELEEDKQRKFRQKYRIEKLTPEEIKTISTEEFIKAKKEYIESLEEVK